MKLVMTIGMLMLAGLSWGTEIELRSILCSGHNQVKAWRYVASGNTYEGFEDTHGYVEIEFAPVASGNGSTKHLKKTFKIEGLSWTENFRQVVFAKNGSELVCAQSGFAGLYRNLKNCDLEFSFVPGSEAEKEFCTGDSATAFIATFKTL